MVENGRVWLYKKEFVAEWPKTGDQREAWLFHKIQVWDWSE